MQRLCVALLAACSTVACVRQLPSAPTPPAVAPPIQAVAPPPSGQGRLVVDVVDGPTPVQRIDMESKQVANGHGGVSYRFFESPKILCAASPCVLDVLVGNVLLGFPVRGDRDATEVELVNVGPETSVYRRSLSFYEDRTGAVRVLGIVLTAVGASATVTGTVLLPIGLSDDNRALATTGGSTLGAGVAVLALGILAIRHDSPTYRPGSSNHFPVTAAKW